MTLSLHIGPKLEAKLRERAARAGKDAEAFVLEAVEEKLRGPRTLDEILAPIRKEVAESGMSDKALDELFESALQESRGKRRSGT